MKYLFVIIAAAFLYACGGSAGETAADGGTEDTQPTVTDVDPRPNATSAMTALTLMTTFDRTMQGGTSGTFVVFGSQTGQIDGSYIGGGSDTLVFDADEAFKTGEEIEVILTNSLRSTEGAFLQEPFVYRFRAEALGGSAEFTADDIVTGQVNNRAIVAGDWDGDGDLDLASAESGGGTVDIIGNDGVGGFAITDTVSVSLDASAMAAGDWDGDGDLDLAVSDAGNNTVEIFEND